MRIYDNSTSTEREAEQSDRERNEREQVDVIHGYDDVITNRVAATKSLARGEGLSVITRQIRGDSAVEAKRFGFEGDQDGTEWMVKTRNGELVIVNVESLAQLTEDLRMLPSGYSVKDLMAIVKGKESNPEIYFKATTLFTPEEKIAIAVNAIENMLCLNDPTALEAAKSFVDGRNEIFILTAEDYQTYNTTYNTNRPESELVYKSGNHVHVRNIKFRHANGRTFTSEAEIAKDDVQIIVLRETRLFSRQQTSDSALGQKVDSSKLKQVSGLEASRTLTHELVHSSGIGVHLGQMEEMTVEFYAVRAETLGEQKRNEKAESLNVSYDAGTLFFSELYTALRNREGLGTSVLDAAFMWGNTKEMQEVANATGHLLGKEGSAKLAKWDFKNDVEAYLWLRDKLSQ